MEEKDITKETNGNAKKVAFITAFLAALVGGAYVHGINYYAERFLPNTFIDEVDVSELTAEEAIAKLSETFEVNEITVNGRNDAKEVMDVSSAGIYRRYSGLEEAIGAQNNKLWIMEKNGTKNPGLPYEYGYNEEALFKAADTLEQLNAEKTSEPVNAHMSRDAESGAFIIIPEDRGNRVNKESFLGMLKLAIENGDGEMHLDELGCYEEPAILSDDEELINKIGYVNALETAAIYLDMAADTIEELHGDDIFGLLGEESFIEVCKNGIPEELFIVETAETENKEGETKATEPIKPQAEEYIPFNEEALNNYVTELAGKYDTYEDGKESLFRTFEGKDILIKNEYGWKLDQEKTFLMLKRRLLEIGEELVANGEIVSTEGSETDPNKLKAVWKKSAASHVGYDYGEYYAEVDLGNQTVYVVDHGKCIFTASCVSGKMTSDRMTPGGIYAIRFKQLHKVLTGYKPDGSIDYQSPVTYWMPFNKGIGFHDATWRGSFGGKIYVYSGSHGCVNLPYSKARDLYDLTYVGMPVILYY